MTVLSFVEKYKLAQRDCIMLYRGVSLSGRDFFAFLRCTLQGVEKLKQDASEPNAERDLSQYGEIIYMDFLADPDAKANEFLDRYLQQAQALYSPEEA